MLRNPYLFITFTSALYYEQLVYQLHNNEKVWENYSQSYHSELPESWLKAEETNSSFLLL